MNVCLACDQLLWRDFSTDIVDLWCEIFPEAKILTMVHQPGAVLGHVEMHAITSSFLSRWSMQQRRLSRLSFLLPQAVQALQVPRGTDVVLSLSRGYIHGLTVPNGVKHISYIYELQNTSLSPQGKIGQKLFAPFLQQWRTQALQRPQHLVFSSQALQQQFLQLAPSHHTQTSASSLVHPFFKFNEFLQANIHGATQNYFVANASGLSAQMAQTLGKLFLDLKIPLHFIGEQPELAQWIRPLQQGQDQKADSLLYIHGYKCDGDVSALLKGAKAVIDFATTPFPHLALCALAMGRPFVAVDSAVMREFLPEIFGLFVGEGPLGQENLRQQVLKMENEYSWYDIAAMRRYVYQYSEMKFRMKWKKIIEH